MALNKLLETYANKKFKKEELTDQRIEDQREVLKKYFAYFREYPDLLIDFYVSISRNTKQGEKSTFRGFYFYQRFFLRVAMRYRCVYATFPRAFSKSFLAVCTLLLRCILSPNANLFITADGKEQAASIAKQKVYEWFELVPPLKDEIDWSRGGQTKEGKAELHYKFKNGAILRVMGATKNTRGQRCTGGLFEEVIDQDPTILNEVIIPTMNVSRRAPNGYSDDEEIINKSQIYIKLIRTVSAFEKSVRVNLFNCRDILRVLTTATSRNVTCSSNGNTLWKVKELEIG